MDNIIKNFNAFIDGRGQAGKVTEFTPPELALKMEEYRAGGMDGATQLEMGQEKMETNFILADYNKENLALWGVAAGVSLPLTLRAAAQKPDGTVVPVVIEMRGKIVKMTEGTFKPGESVKVTVTMAVDYYHKKIDGKSVTEIDVLNCVRKINGTDQLKGMRNALGL